MITKSCGVEWIGDIPQEWEISRIKYVSDFQPTCDTSMLTNESIVTYTPMEYIKNGYYIENDSPYGKLSSSLTQYCEGDIVMAKVTPCFENGNIAIMTNLSSGIGMGSSELFVFRAKRINVKYLFYWLRNTGFVNAACATMTGTGGLKRVSPYFVYNSVICYPKNNEYQQRIVEFLDRKCAEIDSIIAKTKATIEEYKALKQAVITQAVTKGIRPDRPMKDSGVEWIGEIPQEWKCLKSKCIITSLYSGAALTATDFVEDGFPVFGGGQRLGYYSDYNLEKTLVIGRVGAKCGCVTKVDEKAWATDNALIVTTETSIDYLFYILVAAQLNKLNTSNAQPLITSSKVLNFKMPFCESIDEQNEIVEYLDHKCAEIDRLIAAKEQLLTELESYKKSVIYEYVTGKKEI